MGGSEVGGNELRNQRKGKGCGLIQAWAGRGLVDVGLVCQLISEVDQTTLIHM